MVYLYAIVFTLGLTFFVGIFFHRFGKREIEYYSDQKLELSKKQIVILRLGFSVVGLVMLVISLYNLLNGRFAYTRVQHPTIEIHRGIPYFETKKLLLKNSSE